MGTIVEGLASLESKLNEIKRRIIGDWPVTVVVGFSQYYAIYVHEIKKNYRVGDWKYLESASRDLHQQVQEDIRRAIRVNISPELAFFRGGLIIQRAAQERCPMDTGALRASAFTALEKDLDKASSEARARSDAVKKSKRPKKKTTKSPLAKEKSKITYTERTREKYGEQVYKKLSQKFNLESSVDEIYRLHADRFN